MRRAPCGMRFSGALRAAFLYASGAGGLCEMGNGEWEMGNGR